MMPLFLACCAGFLFQMTHLSFQLDERHKLISFLIDVFLIQIFVHYTFQLTALVILFHMVNIFLAAVALGYLGSLIVALSASIAFGISLLAMREGSSSQILMTYCLNLFTFVLVGGIAGYLSELLKQTQMALFDLKEIQRRVYEISPVGILVSKMTAFEQFEVVDYNQAASKILHLQSDGVVSGGEPSSLLSSLLSTKNQGFLAKDVIIDNIEKNLLVQQSQFELSDQLQFLVTAVSDQTELKKLEWDLKQKEKLAAIGGLAAGIAHEIRNPLASISGSIEMLSQNAQSSDDQKLMKIILREISRLNHLISEFLDYAKPESVPNDRVDLQSLIQETLESIRHSKELLAPLTAELVIETNLNKLWIKGSSQKLKQALLNFFINAVQAMKESQKPRLRVGLAQDEDAAVLLEIEDTGAGMSEDVQKKLFEPFFTTKPKGTGLGLAMTHKILSSHQAQIEVVSKLGQGTLFRLKFPLVNPQ